MHYRVVSFFYFYMKVKITNSLLEDYIILEGENIDQIRQQAQYELQKRNWEAKDCWSEEI